MRTRRVSSGERPTSILSVTGGHQGDEEVSVVNRSRLGRGSFWPVEANVTPRVCVLRSQRGTTPVVPSRTPESRWVQFFGVLPSMTLV